MTRILIAEDDADLRLLLRLVLHRAGHQVSEARDGVEALEAMSRETFDVVLLDNLMPRMSGIEVLESVQLLRRVERPLILVVSALATRADIRICMSSCSASAAADSCSSSAHGSVASLGIEASPSASRS